jgi:hypothetical protein
MPKRRVSKRRTPAQIAASKRNLVKARAAKKVTLYHQTTAKGALGIAKQGFKPSRGADGLIRPVWASNSKDPKMRNKMMHYGPNKQVLVSFKVPKSAISKDVVQPSDHIKTSEVWYRAQRQAISSVKIASGFRGKRAKKGLT